MITDQYFELDKFSGVERTPFWGEGVLGFMVDN